MPLLDHFHPPLSQHRQWESFHSAWAEALALQLNRDLLPPRYFAEVHVKVGSRVEIGQTLCILEAMKLMNEINSDYAGVVTSILVESGELVSLGQELLWIEP